MHSLLRSHKITAQDCQEKGKTKGKMQDEFSLALWKSRDAQHGAVGDAFRRLYVCDNCRGVNGSAGRKRVECLQETQVGHCI
jgi:hypothetical protein